jgi:hypothetical protein
LSRRASSATSSVAAGSTGSQRRSPDRPAAEDSPTIATASPCSTGVCATSKLKDARLDPAVLTEPEHGVVVAGIGLARVEQQGLVGQVLQAHRRAVGEPVVAAHEQSLALLPHRAQLEVGVARRAAHDPEVDRAGTETGDDRIHRPDLGRHGDARIALAKLVQEPRRGVVARAGPVGDHDAPALAGPEARDAAPELVGVAEQQRPALEQVRAGLGESEFVRGAVQQLHAELLLEQAHLPAERRLRHVQPLRRPGEVPLLRNREEVLQPSQLGHRRGWYSGPRRV